MKNFTEDGFFDNDYDIIKEYKDKQTEKRINKIMAKTESARSDGVQAIGIMTPSGDHYKIAKEFIINKFI